MKNSQILLAFLAFLAFAIASHCDASSPWPVSGIDLFSNQPKNISLKPQEKGLVVVFLSAKCPCSNSHIPELKSLAQDFPEFAFVGVHSNTDEPKVMAVEYFEKLKLPFSILQDEDTQLADHFKALKTPHVFVIHPSGETVYRGGISDSNHFENAEKKFLRDALEDLKAGTPVRKPETRTLGCAISRSKKS